MLLLWLASAFIAGDVVGAYFPVLPVEWAELATICGGLVVAARSARVRQIPLLACALACGLALSPHAGPLSRTSAARLLNRHVDVIGVVAAEPDVRNRTVIYTVNLASRRQSGRAVPLSGEIEVRTSAAVDVPYGERLEMKGALLAIAGAAHDTLVRRGIVGQLSYPRIADLGSAGTDWHGFLIGIRQRIENGINRWLPEPDAALLIAITLGSRSASLGDLAHPLTVTGLIHLVAISGIKVSLFAGMAYQLVRRAGHRALSSVLPLMLLWSYVAITGFTASGTRSAIMWTLVFTATALGRDTVALVSLGGAVAFMVALTPALPWDTGFEMSALGTFFIVAFAGPLTRVARAVPPPFREALAVTFAAQIGTLPVVIAGFHVASSTGPLANALVLPLIPALIVLGIILGIGAALTFIAAPLAASAHILCSAVAQIATFGASHSPPYAVTSLPFAVTTAYYALISGVAVTVLRRAKWRPPGRYSGLTLQFALAGVVAVGGLSSYMARAQSADEVRSLGTGESVLIQSGGQVILIDGSPRPFVLLEALGKALSPDRRAIDVVAVTDPRSSNILGLREVAARYHVGEVLDVGMQYPDTTYAQWRDQLRASRVPVYALRRGISVTITGVTLTGVSPDDVCPVVANCAGIVRITTKARSYLVASAASPREQFEAVFRSVRLRSDVLFAAASTLDPAFLKTVGASTIVRLNPKQ